MSDPECRDVCEKAYETLQKKGDTTNSHVAKLSSAEALAPIAKSALGESAGKLPAHVLDFVCGLALALVDIKMFEAEAWTNTITPFVAPYAEADAAADVPKQVRLLRLGKQCDTGLFVYRIFCLAPCMPRHVLVCLFPPAPGCCCRGRDTGGGQRRGR